MSASTKTVGSFTLNISTGDLAGPADYMRSENYRKRIAAIEAGTDTLSTCSFASPDPATAILVSLQTDYAAWRGHRDLMRRMAG